jgi:hypothetical protein
MQYRAYAVSLVRHLNRYGGDQTLPAFLSPPVRDDDPAATAAMVYFLHAHGGIDTPSQNQLPWHSSHTTRTGRGRELGH